MTTAALPAWLNPAQVPPPEVTATAHEAAAEILRLIPRIADAVDVLDRWQDTLDEDTPEETFAVLTGLCGHDLLTQAAHMLKDVVESSHAELSRRRTGAAHLLAQIERREALGVKLGAPRLLR